MQNRPELGYGAHVVSEFCMMSGESSGEKIDPDQSSQRNKDMAAMLECIFVKPYDSCGIFVVLSATMKFLVIPFAIKPISSSVAVLSRKMPQLFNSQMTHKISTYCRQFTTYRKICPKTPT